MVENKRINKHSSEYRANLHDNLVQAVYKMYY